jgi:hypothetical protein
MKHLINYTYFKESLGDEDQLTVIQAIGLLQNPKNDILGYPEGIKPNSPESKQIIELLKEFLKGSKLNDKDREQIDPVLIFVEDLKERGQRDKSVVVYLDKYKKDGEKVVGVYSKIKSFVSGQKREKNPLFDK